MSTKRKRTTSSAQSTPSKRTRAEVVYSDLQEEKTVDEEPATPGKRVSKKTAKALAAASPNGVLTLKKSILTQTPKTAGRVKNLDTPSKVRFDLDAGKASPLKDVNRSAKRKANARVIKKAISQSLGGDVLSDEEDAIAHAILSEDEEVSGDEAGNGELNQSEEPETPSKGRRGRPKGSKNRRSPTPPLADLPPHEVYFWQNRPGAGKTSNNTLPTHLLLDHDQYFAHGQAYVDPHLEERQFLLDLHRSAFKQWLFELEQGFNICLYGFGSKRAVIQALAEQISEELDANIVIVNGYNSSASLRAILTTIASTLFNKNIKLPLQPAALLQLIIEILDDKPKIHDIYLLVNSLDAGSMRKSAVQTVLASLAKHPRIHLVATTDTANFPLLWDISMRQDFRFVYHDCTTFAPFDEAEIDVVESVNELLGRSGRRVGGRDGVGYVLKSLPENARNLYRILVAEQLAASIETEDVGNGDEAMINGDTAVNMGKKDVTSEAGVEYRILYHKAREELVCSTEHQFRTLLKEFYDHQMVESKRDALGAERLVVPFRKEDLEGLLEELVE